MVYFAQTGSTVLMQELSSPVLFLPVMREQGREREERIMLFKFPLPREALGQCYLSEVRGPTASLHTVGYC